MVEKKKYRIEYLDIDDNFYIENDRVKLRHHKDTSSQRETWDEVWMGAWKIIEAAMRYDEEHNRFVGQ